MSIKNACVQPLRQAFTTVFSQQKTNQKFDKKTAFGLK